jgi:hypothetical protein
MALQAFWSEADQRFGKLAINRWLGEAADQMQ